ncbi:MAG TPA: NAD(P)/FAD-dependent oxidoreductase [Alphaproteobacteria bacterium]|nr:NAD(P)/FAD-dependent oxidoreductase [Alphaproteobacteria bacterium]
MGSSVDVVIVGAGAAGLSAAKAATGAGLSHIIVEAEGRSGGRAYTELSTLGLPMDHGAHYLHAASRNPLRDYADQHGLPYKRGGYTTKIFDGHWFSDDEQANFLAVAKKSLAEIALRADCGNQLSSHDVLVRSRLWSGADEKYRPLFDGYYAEFLGAEASEVAAGEHSRYQDSYEDWPVENGYGALIAHYGADTPVVLQAAVREVDHTGRNIIVKTRKGDIRARTVLLTVSTGVLASEMIRFTPPLPNAKNRAIDAIPMGYAGKIAFRLEGGQFAGIETHHGLINRPDGLFANLHIRPFERPLAILIVGGPKWEVIERAGADAMIAMGRRVISDLFGSRSLRDLKKTLATKWVSDPHTLGGHSYMRPGHGFARADLAEPIDNRIFFAGEATSSESWATVHGAYESGRRAISEAAAALKKSRVA